MMSFDDTERDLSLTPEEEAQARLLTIADLKRIDECLLSHAGSKWYKVARVVAHTMKDLEREFPEIPATFYGLRIKHLVESGAIEAAGNLNRMRHSEVRLPSSERESSR